MSTAHARLAWKVQSAFGTQATGTGFNKVRLGDGGESLQMDQNTVLDGEIHEDHRPKGVVTLARSGSGTVNGNLSHTSWDTWFELALRSAGFSSATTIGPITTVSFESIATSSTSYAKIKDSGNGLAGLSANQWISVSGSTLNNVIAKIHSVAAGEIEIKMLDLTDEVAGDSVTLKQLGQIVDGTDQRVMTVEKIFTQNSNRGELYNDVLVNTMGVNCTPGDKVKLSFGLMTGDVTVLNAAHASGYNTKNTNPIFTVGGSTVGIYENETKIASNQFTINVDGQNRAQEEAGEMGPGGYNRGDWNIGGTWRQYFGTNDSWSKMRNSTETSFATVQKDSAGNIVVFDVPSVYLVGNGRRVAGNANSDVIQEFTWQAVEDSTEGILMRIAVLAA